MKAKGNLFRQICSLVASFKLKKYDLILNCNLLWIGSFSSEIYGESLQKFVV